MTLIVFSTCIRVSIEPVRFSYAKFGWIGCSGNFGRCRCRCRCWAATFKAGCTQSGCTRSCIRRIAVISVYSPIPVACFQLRIKDCPAWTFLNNGVSKITLIIAATVGRVRIEPIIKTCTEVCSRRWRNGSTACGRTRSGCDSGRSCVKIKV